MTPRRLALIPLAAASAAALALAGCATTPAPGPTETTGQIRVVASTDVYGDIAGVIGGDAAEVQSLISGSAQDPHSFEASAQDRLAVEDADVVIVNGGGYDDFMTTLLDASGGGQTVIDAVDISGLPGAGQDGFNEHVWYDFGAIQTVAKAIADAYTAIRPADAATFAANLDAFDTQVDALAARAATIAADVDGAGALVTEPVPLYLLEACGFVNVTPEAFSEAVEEGTDISPSLLDEVLTLVRGGTISIFGYNEQTVGPETEDVLAAAKAAAVPVVSFTETLPDGEDYVEWMTANLDAIAAAVR